MSDDRYVMLQGMEDLSNPECTLTSGEEITIKGMIFRVEYFPFYPEQKEQKVVFSFIGLANR